MVYARLSGDELHGCCDRHCSSGNKSCELVQIKKKRQRRMQNRAEDKDVIITFWIIFTIIACVIIFSIVSAVLPKESKADEQPVEYVLTAQTGTGVIRDTYKVTYQKAKTMTYSGSELLGNKFPSFLLQDWW
jgi:hypothetical protein